MTGRTAGIMFRVLGATVIGVLPVFLIGSLSVLIAQDLPLNVQRLGVVAAAFWAAAALLSWPAGHLADRVGPPWALGAGAMLSATAAVGVATSGGLGPLLASVVVGGAGNALIVPGCNLAVARCLAPQRQGTAFGFKQAAVSSSVFMAGIGLPIAVAIGGWRAAFVGAGVLAVLCAGAMIRWQCVAASPARTQPMDSFTLPRRGLFLLAAAAGMASATNTSLTAFFVVSAVEGGRDVKAAGALLSIGATLGIAARLALGGRADRNAGPGLREISILLLLGAPGFALLAWPASSMTLLAGTALAFGAGWGWTGLYHLAIIRLSPHAPAAATGAASTALFLGAIMGPWGFGTLASATSFRLAWFASGAWLLVAALGVHLTRQFWMTTY
jgi:predicted MFS family arabinose efflux permease